MSNASAPRGRPRLADREVVRAIAISYLARIGYEQATMPAVATHCGLSVRTLHRYFATKADIVLGGTEATIEELRSALSAAPRDISVLAGLSWSIQRVLGNVAGAPEPEKDRLRLIALNPSLAGGIPGAQDAWTDEVAQFIADGLGLTASSRPVRAASVAVQAATSEALAWWASEGSTDDPVRFIAESLGCLGDAAGVKWHSGCA